jgi:hypothetical protein
MAGLADVVVVAGLLIGIWWGVRAVGRLFGPRRPPASPGPAPIPNPRPRARTSNPRVEVPARTARLLPCCPGCASACQVTGLILGQSGDRGDGWWGQPFGDDGPNSEAMTFWGTSAALTAPPARSVKAPRAPRLRRLRRASPGDLCRGCGGCALGLQIELGRSDMVLRAVRPKGERMLGGGVSRGEHAARGYMAVGLVWCESHPERTGL